ncbi:DUF6879 family protein [Nocardiopsis sp. FIRDI 009]|uniref:DUF6879 family protein n=1 Tax=Nocardiopsis sp. FIRDI 009 TaxID=714197 RepID=UPI003515E839
MWAYRANVRAGEDVNILPVADGSSWPGGLPRFDYWPFDSHRLVRMNYDSDVRRLAPELVTDPAQIVQANAVRDRSLPAAVPSVSTRSVSTPTCDPCDRTREDPACLREHSENHCEHHRASVIGPPAPAWGRHLVDRGGLRSLVTPVVGSMTGSGRITPRERQSACQSAPPHPRTASTPR